MSQFSSSVEVDNYDHPVDVIVKFEYHAFHRGLKGGFGVPIEPDEPECVEIENIELADTGESIYDEVPIETIDRLETEIVEYIESSRAEALGNHCDMLNGAKGV